MRTKPTFFQKHKPMIYAISAACIATFLLSLIVTNIHRKPDLKPGQQVWLKSGELVTIMNKATKDTYYIRYNRVSITDNTIFRNRHGFVLSSFINL